MDTTGDPTAPSASAPPRAPQPPRPAVVVTPLRDHRTDPGPTPRTLTAAVTAWAASFAVFACLAAALSADYDAVVAALDAALTTGDPTADPTTVDQVSGLIVLGVGCVGLLLVLAGVLGIVRLRSGRGRGRAWLTVVGVLTVAAAMTSWSALSDAGDLVFRTLSWAPPLQAALVVVGTALLFAPSASAWLRRRSIS
ncbi:hypothetical protein P9209_08085 [Prescottella defluvii]|nr:hypothetical protein P9209_08085 [Prescottella defluvii]